MRSIVLLSATAFLLVGAILVGGQLAGRLAVVPRAIVRAGIHSGRDRARRRQPGGTARLDPVPDRLRPDVRQPLHPARPGVDPHVVDLLLKAKGPENIVLITDAISAAGMPDGRYQLGSFEVELKDGKCVSDGSLAGSALTLDQAVRNVMQFAKWDLQKTLRAATLNPASVAGAQKKGIIEPGADADFVVLTPGGEVRATIVKGVVIQ